MVTMQRRYPGNLVGTSPPSVESELMLSSSVDQSPRARGDGNSVSVRQSLTPGILAFQKKGKNDSQLGYATMSITGQLGHAHSL